MDQWEIKDTAGLNRFLKVRSSLKIKEYKDLGVLLTITHKYNTNDDMIFPMPQTLAFINGFEDHLLQNDKELVYIANDVHDGIINLYAYISNDAQKAIDFCIEYFKKFPEYKIDFHLQNDPTWSVFQRLKDL